MQSSKLLGDTSVPQFYPSIFVLVGEILDTLGRLVFDRIMSKALRDSARKIPGENIGVCVCVCVCGLCVAY